MVNIPLKCYDLPTWKIIRNVGADLYYLLTKFSGYIFKFEKVGQIVNPVEINNM